MAGQKALTGKSIRGGWTHACRLAGLKLHESISSKVERQGPRFLFCTTATTISRLKLKEKRVVNHWSLALLASTKQLSLDWQSIAALVVGCVRSLLRVGTIDRGLLTGTRHPLGRRIINGSKKERGSKTERGKGCPSKNSKNSKIHAWDSQNAESQELE